MACCDTTSAVGPVAPHDGDDYEGVTGPGADYEGFLEDAVKAEWDEELDHLFGLWDTDNSGVLEMAEIGDFSGAAPSLAIRR